MTGYGREGLSVGCRLPFPPGPEVMQAAPLCETRPAESSGLRAEGYQNDTSSEARALYPSALFPLTLRV